MEQKLEQNPFDDTVAPVSRLNRKISDVEFLTYFFHQLTIINY